MSKNNARVLFAIAIALRAVKSSLTSAQCKNMKVSTKRWVALCQKIYSISTNNISKETFFVKCRYKQKQGFPPNTQPAGKGLRNSSMKFGTVQNRWNFAGRVKMVVPDYVPNIGTHEYLQSMYRQFKKNVMFASRNNSARITKQTPNFEVFLYIYLTIMVKDVCNFLS